MSTTLIRDLLAAKLGNEPEAFQFLTDDEPDISWFQQLFSIDLRSLAILRILLGLIVIMFIFNQIAYTKLLYTDEGILSRPISQQFIGSGYWSILWLNGSFNFARSFLLITGIVAGVFVFGYQTKLMNFILLVLVWSIQIRNPLILTGGDVLLRMLLFWSLFLPTNAIWSFDATQMERRPDRWLVASVGTVAIMLQVVYMYFFSGLAKLNPFWFNGDAVEYAMHLEMSVKPIGAWFGSHPGILKVATLVTVIAEILIPFVLFIPRLYHLNRGIMLGFFLLLHLGIWLTLSIGLFSLTAIAAWVVFVPSDIWNGWLGQPVGFDEKSVYGGESKLLNRISTIVCSVFLVYITIQNVLFAFGPNVSNQFSSLEQIGRTTMTIQKFQMFAEPPLYSPWFEYNAQLDSGQWVDVFFPERKNTTEKPESVYDYMQSQNWRRIHWNLITHPVHPPESELVYREIRRRVLQSIVERWDAEHLEDPVLTAELRCHLDAIKIEREGADTPEFKDHRDYNLIWAAYQNDQNALE